MVRTSPYTFRRPCYQSSMIHRTKNINIKTSFNIELYWQFFIGKSLVTKGIFNVNGKFRWKGQGIFIVKFNVDSKNVSKKFLHRHSSVIKIWKRVFLSNNFFPGTIFWFWLFQKELFSNLATFTKVTKKNCAWKKKLLLKNSFLNF